LNGFSESRLKGKKKKIHTFILCSEEQNCTNPAEIKSAEKWKRQEEPGSSPSSKFTRACSDATTFKAGRKMLFLWKFFGNTS